MSDRLLDIQLSHVKELYQQLPEDLEQALLATREKDSFHFNAFGEPCILSPEGIFLGGEKLSGPKGVLIALYARHACKEPVQLTPVKSFRQIKASMPYQAAFAAYSEKSLAPFVNRIQSAKDSVIAAFDGHENAGGKGNLSFTLYALPKVPLHYNCYLADEEFPASVTCLFAANAELFMPVAGLADVAEYTAKKVIEMVST